MFVYGTVCVKLFPAAPQHEEFLCLYLVYFFSSFLKMSTSQKHRNFVSEPMGDKAVTELAGIGETLGGRLRDKGFDKAYVVLGQFLVLKKNEELFGDWLNQTCGANSKQQKDCSVCLRQWCDSFL